ncbi:MAG: C25 family cysteine peptidase, partial [Candidatus Thermoplasmatota archaeon]|nr:C25 family cysteine peptidase [Candidatus Thermoplasmatota archaeon]
MFKKASILIIVIFILSIFNITVVSDDGYNNSTKNNLNISLKFNFSKPTLSTFNINNEEYFKIKLDDLPVSDKFGEPKLPVKPLRILLPYSTDVEKISVKTSEEKIMEDNVFSDIELGGMSRSLDSSLYDNEIIPQYEKDYIYPKQVYNNLGIQCLNGYLILFINLHPVRYLGQTNTVYYYDNISISIETTEYTYNNILQKFDDKEKILNMVENPQMLSSYPDEDTSFNQGTSNYEYVIITTDDLKNASGNYTFYDLIDKRINDGLTCKIKTVENIYQEYEGVDNTEKIRNFIKDAYINWNTKWVLIGGDVEKVPIRYLCDIDGAEKDETKITSDVYYQCLDGDYNYDRDGNWGEEFDGVNGKRIDLLAEVYVGRAPVDDGEDISAFVEKTLSYENSDWFEDPYLQNVLSAGENLWTGTGGDGSEYVERCIDYCTDYNQNTYGIPSNRFTITKLYEDLEPWTDE